MTLHATPHKKQLVWKEEYSVEVKEIDEQHKNMFIFINRLIELINAGPNEKDLLNIIQQIATYKSAHFETEEKYFHKFDFEGTIEHENAHKQFGVDLKAMQERFKGDVYGFAFSLVDFLEDWLIGHLKSMDQKYKKCFKEHGLS